jgi:hypothetical protein
MDLVRACCPRRLQQSGQTAQSRDGSFSDGEEGHQGAERVGSVLELCQARERAIRAVGPASGPLFSNCWEGLEGPFC